MTSEQTISADPPIGLKLSAGIDPFASIGLPPGDGIGARQQLEAGF